jgi:hypothetical protein
MVTNRLEALSPLHLEELERRVHKLPGAWESRAPVRISCLIG